MHIYVYIQINIYIYKNLGHRRGPNCGTSQIPLLTVVNKDILPHSDTTMTMYSAQNRH